MGENSNFVGSIACSGVAVAHPRAGESNRWQRHPLSDEQTLTRSYAPIARMIYTYDVPDCSLQRARLGACAQRPDVTRTL